MLATTPADAIRLADEAFNRGDLDGFLSFYEPNARIQFEVGDPLIGILELRSRFEAFMRFEPVATQEAVHIIESGDLALATTRWKVTGVGPNGPFSRGADGSAILRRGADGGWRVAVENPWGVAVLNKGT